ncbi:Hematological/neurological-like protein [Balamuthia mandrillaris]
MSSGKGHVYGFNIKSAGSSTSSNASSSGASKPAIIDDKLFSTVCFCFFFFFFDRLEGKFFCCKFGRFFSGFEKPHLFLKKKIQKHVPKKDVEKGIQKGTGEVPKGYGI